MNWPAKHRRTPEHDFQKLVIQWLHITLKPPAFATSIDHAGNDRLRGALRKSRGVMPGLADVWVFAPGGRVTCLELKAMDGRLSDAQLAMAARLGAIGIRTYECRTLEEVQAALDDRGVLLRQRLQPRAVELARLT